MYPFNAFRYVTDILKMCMKKFNAEKIIFDKFTGFWSALCGGYTVSLACCQFLVILSIAGKVSTTVELVQASS